MTGSDRTRTLQERLSTGEILVAPGCYDALGAKLVEHAGFDACYMTGFGTSAALLGAPDIGLLTATDMADNARRLVAATSLPVIADADTGYGNALNVSRTVRAYEMAGVAALQLEDQVSPKRCGHMEDKAVVPVSEMVSKVRAACDARSNPDLLVIARTDARSPEGFNAALDRANAYAEAGADMLFIEALESIEELTAAGAAELGRPLVYNAVDGGKSPLLSAEQAGALGYAVMLAPIASLLHATAASLAALQSLATSGTLPPAPSVDPAQPNPFDAFTTLVGLPGALELQHRYES